MWLKRKRYQIVESGLRGANTEAFIAQKAELTAVQTLKAIHYPQVGRQAEMAMPLMSDF